MDCDRCHSAERVIVRRPGFEEMTNMAGSLNAAICDTY